MTISFVVLGSKVLRKDRKIQRELTHRSLIKCGGGGCCCFNIALTKFGFVTYAFFLWKKCDALM